ncbi:MAG: Cof-type HAD-IIB family hydrolase [Marinisporobacter sp.]|nr:Cof-type HAD-IIB family hydrolase [Marinisporobacter sp.]
MYKLLVLDMDGTLLDEHQRISEENIIAVKKAQQMGIKIVIATGRTKKGIGKYLEALDLINKENYSVVCSGALVLNNTDEIIGVTPLKQEEFKYVFDLANELNITLNMYAEDGILVHYDNYFSRFDAVANDLPLKIVDYHSLDEETLITKIMLINEDLSVAEEIKSFFPSIDIEDRSIALKEDYDKDLFKDVSKLPSDLLKKFTVAKVTPYNVEILNKNANKRTGVERIARELKIKPEEIICIGDSGNDRHMIEYAGLGVAMGNAFPEIKKIADYVTYTNEENGVAHVIEKFILK